MEQTAYILFISFISSVGFALMFNMPSKWIFPSSLGGLLTWAAFLICQQIFDGAIFVPCFIASVFAALWAFGLARFSHNPFGMYFMIAVVPLIPGSGLYYTIFNLSQGNGPEAQHYLQLTTEYALAITFGISIVWAGIEIYRSWLRKHTTNDC